MKTDIKNLPKSSECLEKIVISLSDELEKINNELKKEQQEYALYRQKYTLLIEEIRLAKQQRFTPSSEKNLLQKDLFDEAGVDLPDEVLDEISDVKIDVKSYTRKKRPIRKPLPSYLPREIIEYDISKQDKICNCGKHMVRIGEETSEQLKYIPAKICVVKHVRPKYACKPCQENIKIAPMPKLLLPKSIATPELITRESKVIAKL